MNTAAANPTHELLNRLWERNLPLLHERLATLEAAATAAQTKLPTDLRTQAIAEAHKLAGSLGMFGYPQATEIAREIEVLLEEETLSPDPVRLTTLTAALRASLFPSS